MGDVVVKSFNDSGCIAHLIGCAATRQALLVDPKVGRGGVYQKALADHGLTLAAVVDTHTHADHLSDSAAWLERGVPLWMSAKTTCARPHRGLKQGDVVNVGKLELRVLELPGHTPDSIALHRAGRGAGSGEGFVLTGDTLLVGGLARADFRGSDPAALFDSVRRELLSLPDSTVVLPAHGYLDLLFSTIGHERAHNPALKHASGEAYAAALHAVEGAGNSPDVDATLTTNVAADPKLPDSPVAVAACCAMSVAGSGSPAASRIREMTCEELAPRRAALAGRKSWLDVRDPWELSKEGRIPGALNFPLSELGFHLSEVGALARASTEDEPMVLSCRSGVRSMTAAKTLAYLGVLKAPISMAGGFGRWKELGLPTE
jgi:glyoxylase-like metal-dependent hydrolase (beta-lactamase superfamily II)/rhodanese-related sulfurtransferase